MSVLIKGMKMPEHGCNHCFLRDRNYCTRIKQGDYVNVVKFSLEETRHPNCPLVEVKTPHGRLIDADELGFLQIRDENENPVSPKFVPEEFIDEAETIIEAEE